MPGQPEITCPPDPAGPTGIMVTEFNVLDTNGIPSNLIIDAGDPFSLEVKFLIGGPGAALYKSLDLAYTVQYFYEGFGIVGEGKFNDATGSLGTAPDAPTCLGAYECTATTNVPAGTLNAGTFKLTAVISFDNALVNISGHIVGPVIQIRA